MVATRKWWRIASMVCGLWLGVSLMAGAQVRRYEPARPTVSPYLNLFRPNNGILPNYQSLVRPLQQQYAFNQTQQQINQQQSQTVQQLQTDVQTLQQQPGGALVTPTGKSGWFSRPSSRHQFMNTSRYYSRSGSTPLSASSSR